MKLRIYVDLFRPQGGFSSYNALTEVTREPQEGDTVKIAGIRFTLNIVRHFTGDGAYSTYIRIDGNKFPLEPLRRKLLDSGFTLTSRARPRRK